MPTLPLLLIPEPISSETRKAFALYPWCLQLFEDTRYVPVRTMHQSPLPNVPSRLLGTTLRDHDAIQAVQSLYHYSGRDTGEAIDPALVRPLASDIEGTHEISRPSSIASHAELHTLYVLGDGVSGHNGISHGGFTATLLDQQAGSLIIADPTTPRPHTVYCHVRYLRTVHIPNAVRVKAWKTRVEGRKHWVNVELSDGEDRLLAAAETLFVDGTVKL